MLGKLAVVTRATHTGIEVVLGTIVAPLHIEETNEGREVITMVTVEGEVIETTIRGLPLPIETAGRSITLELVPVRSRHPGLIRMRLL